MAWVDSGQPRL